MKNLKSETESLQIAQNNAIMTHHVEVKIDYTQRTLKSGERQETFDHMISEFSNQAEREY